MFGLVPDFRLVRHRIVKFHVLDVNAWLGIERCASATLNTVGGRIMHRSKVVAVGLRRISPSHFIRGCEKTSVAVSQRTGVVFHVADADQRS